MLARTALCLIAFFHVTTGTGQLWIRLNSLHSNEYCDIHQGVSNSDCYLRILVCVDDSYECATGLMCVNGRGEALEEVPWVMDKYQGQCQNVVVQPVVVENTDVDDRRFGSVYDDSRV